MAFANKYRPVTVDQMMGDKHLFKSCLKTIKAKEPPHTWLIHGPRGCGKTTLARILANSIDCEILEVNGADKRNIDDARSVAELSRYRPLGKENLAIIIDEVHCLSKYAQSTLLKPLEEPTSFCFYFLCTTDPQELLKTTRSRCYQVQLGFLQSDQISQLLKDVSTAEGYTLPQKDLIEIANMVDGCPREALTKLEEYIGNDGHISSIKDSETEVIELCRALVKKASWGKVVSLVQNLSKEDPEGIRRMVMRYCASCIKNETVSDSSYRARMIMECFRDPFFNDPKEQLAMAVFDAMNDS